MNSLAWVKNLALSGELAALAEQALDRSAEPWEACAAAAIANQIRVLRALQEVKLDEADFQDGTGYGYHDRGREKLEAAFARAFQSEAALVRTQMVSGTHALTVALFALLRPGELLLCLTGEPYDTLQAVIGSRGEAEGTLLEWGVRYRYLPTDEHGLPEPGALEPGLRPRVAYIQRSAGYSVTRNSLTIAQINGLVEQVRALYPGAWVVVDNCYGEFVEPMEPPFVGADLAVGSLIKNPGGGLAPGGAYAAGKRELIHKMAARLTAPGLYGNLGAATNKRSLFQGLFMAPQLVENALKNAVFAASLFELMGYAVRPRFDQPRGDIVQAVNLGSRAKVIRFCQAIQEASPVEPHLTLEPGSLPGYRDPVVMAAGTFFQGASGELTADAPVREPYTVFLQGGLTLPHALWATCQAARTLREMKE